MAGFTNKGKTKLLYYVFYGTALPANMYVALCTSTYTPDADTNTMSNLEEIAAGSGYTSGGIALTYGTTSFDEPAEDDTNNLGKVLLKDVAWTATGTFPVSGGGARWAVLTDYNPVVGDRNVLAYWDLVSARSVSNGQTLTLQDCTLQLTET